MPATTAGSLSAEKPPCRSSRDDPAWLAERLQFDQDLRTRLRVLRLHLGLTQHEMAARLGVSVRAYRHRERQGTSIGTMFWLRVAMEFNVSLSWLISGATGELPRNDRRPLTPDGRAIPPKLRVAAPFPGRPAEIAFLRWVRTLPRELLPDLLVAMQAYAAGPPWKARALMLEFLLAAGYPDAERRIDKLMRSGLQVVDER
jgi:transcriptional regulator with XRE-family HTH domain